MTHRTICCLICGQADHTSSGCKSPMAVYLARTPPDTPFCTELSTSASVDNRADGDVRRPRMEETE